MNFSIVQEILRLYKANFDEIHNDEIYKWAAAAHFRKHWNPEAEDFKEMLLKSLAKTKNLMDSGNYYPKRMLTEYLNKDVSAVKGLFTMLYGSATDVRERIKYFFSVIHELQQQYTPGFNHFQDGRAVMVYLSLRYPDEYFLYKYEMFKAFSKLVQYPYHPKLRQPLDNILLYQNMCFQLLMEIKKDDKLIKLHQKRLKLEHFPDSNLHILTQDVIYAATRYFTNITAPGCNGLIEIVSKTIKPNRFVPELKGRFINYTERAAQQKQTGDMGELAILKYEQEKLKALGIYDKHPKPVSLTDGDGLGYDILSYDEYGNQIFIEVKTTHSKAADFYITAQELIKSIEKKEHYFLYRLFDFNEATLSGKLYIWQGDLTPLCINATVYTVNYDLEDHLKSQ